MCRMYIDVTTCEYGYAICNMHREGPYYNKIIFVPICIMHNGIKIYIKALGI